MFNFLIIIQLHLHKMQSAGCNSHLDTSTDQQNFIQFFFFFFKFIVVCEVEIFSLIQSSGIFVHFDGRSLPHWLFTAVFDLYAIPDAKNDGTILDTSLSIFSTQIRNRAIRVMQSNGNCVNKFVNSQMMSLIKRPSIIIKIKIRIV